MLFGTSDFHVLFLAPKVVRFESKWIASLSLFVKLTLGIGCMYLMFQRNSYQTFDRSPISAVTIKVKQSSTCAVNASIMRYFPEYNCSQSVYDVNDFILPATENSAVSITTRITEIEHVLRNCDNSSLKEKPTKSASLAVSTHQCYHRAHCILPPFYRYKYENESILQNTDLCWFELPSSNGKRNYQALDYILFVKHFVEFPQLGLVRHNVVPDIIDKSYIDTCEYDPLLHPLCPKFRILKILQLVESNPREYERMFYFGSLIEIKISWKCNLDRRLEFCEPHYEFQRLDVKPYEENPYDPGSNFLTSRHFFGPGDQELHRVHTNIYNLHIIISVTGEVGKFDLFQTTTSIGSFLGIFGTGTIVCDLIAAFFTNFKSVKYDTWQ